MLQKTVNKQYAVGMVGEFYDDSPRRATGFIVKSNGDVLPTVGRAFTYGENEGEVKIGGDGVFAGILVNPKEYARYNNFEATLTIPDGVAGTIASFGHVLVKVENEVAIGNAAFYSNTTGAIKAAAAGSSQAGYTEIKNSRFILFSTSSADKTAVLELGN